ncbi:MAG: alkaline phosphatase [Planctomycetota bacterium]
MPTNTKMIGRRGVIGLGAAGAASFTMPTLAAPSAVEPIRRGRRLARNVIFVVVDGMSIGTFTLAEMMLDVRGRGPSHWSRLWSRNDVRRALCTTYSADGWVTDSAAAGSAWGIGEHINNGAVNFTPDGRIPEPILVTAKKHGKATGLVTTTRLTHATPASFVANVPKRSMEDEIARQMIARDVDVLLGGGAKHFGPLLDAFESGSLPGLSVVKSRRELAEAGVLEGRILGLFDRDHLAYEIDRGKEQPSLAEMTRAALTRLDKASQGFVLQVEGGRVDHAAHGNDAAGLIADQIAFDDALGVVAEWTIDRDDTLVVVTTDHGNANPGLTYYGDDGVKSFERLAEARHSFEWIFRTAGERGTFESFIEAVHAASRVELTPSDIELLRRRIVDDQPLDAFGLASGKEPALGAVLANHFGVAFLSPNHTSDLVEVTSFGPGSETMPMRIDNVHLHGMALAAMSDEHVIP